MLLLAQFSKKVSCREHQVDKTSITGSDSQNDPNQNISDAHQAEKGHNRRVYHAFGSGRYGSRDTIDRKPPYDRALKCIKMEMFSEMVRK